MEILELKHVPKNKTKMQLQLSEIEVQLATSHLHWQGQRKAQELFIIHFPAKMGSNADVKVEALDMAWKFLDFTDLQDKGTISNH